MNRTPVFDYEKGDFLVEKGTVAVVEDDAAIQVIITKAQATPRGVYSIYANQDDVDLDHKYGSDVQSILNSGALSAATRDSELKRAITEAISYDPLITDVGPVTIAVSIADDGSKMAVASFDVSTTYDTQLSVEGVNISG